MITERREFSFDKATVEKILRAYVKERFEQEPTSVNFAVRYDSYLGTSAFDKVTIGCDIKHNDNSIGGTVKTLAERKIDIGAL